MENPKDYGKIVSKNLKRIAYEKQKSQVDIAKDLGISKTTLSGWFLGTRVPKMNKIDLLCEYFGVEREDIMEPYDPNKPKTTDGVRIPVLGDVAAGLPILASENIIDWEEIPYRMAESGNYFGLRIRGDSMSPRIMEGDVVIVREQPDVESGDIAIVRVNGESATCKRVLKGDKSISLISFNPLYSPKTFTDKEIESMPVEIIGKVVELRGKF